MQGNRWLFPLFIMLFIVAVGGLFATATSRAATLGGESVQATQAATIDVLSTLNAAFVPFETATTPASIGIQQPVVSVAVSALRYHEPFNHNRQDYWYEGDIEEVGHMDIDDGVYRFTYTKPTPDDVFWLLSESIVPTEANTLLEYEFRIVGCTRRTEFTTVGIFFDTTRTATYYFIISCNDVLWSLVRLGDINENVDFGLFNIEDRFFREWHTVSAWFLEDEVIFYLDGVELTRQPIARAEDGFTYLYFNSDDPLTAEFDNIRVWDLEVPASP
jgi:hypothetical protein